MGPIIEGRSPSKKQLGASAKWKNFVYCQQKSAFDWSLLRLYF